MAIHVASCEDNAAIQDTLSNFFNKIKEEENIELSVDFFSSGEELLSKKKSNYDIYVLDINMGDNNLDGMTLAKALREYDDMALIIFLTSLTRYLKDGYKVRAYRYLTKPICYEEFKHEMCCAVKDLRKYEERFINIIGPTQYNKLLLDDIYYIETHGRKTLVHTRDNDLLCAYSIGTMTSMLQDRNFYRCHNSYLINLNHVEYFDNRIVRVHGIDILISRNKLNGLKEQVASAMADFI